MSSQNACNLSTFDCGKMKLATPTSTTTTPLGKLTRQNGRSDLHNAQTPNSSNSSIRKRRLVSIDAGYISNEDAGQNKSENTGITSTPKLQKLEIKSHSTSELEIKKSEYHLDTLNTNCSTAFRRISAETLAGMMKTMSEEEFDEKYMLVDCRYGYEYDGGHIKGAINLFNPNLAQDIFFTSTGTPTTQKIPIFYCEYSQKRGPSMASLLRTLDRELNANVYPKCAYEEIYVLDKGYRGFFEHSKDMEGFCEPNNYVTMLDPRYSKELRKYQQHRKGASKLARLSKSTSSLPDPRLPTDTVNTPRKLTNFKRISKSRLIERTPRKTLSFDSDDE